MPRWTCSGWSRLPPDHPYWAHPNVTVTPHIASETRPATAAQVICDNIVAARRVSPSHHLCRQGAWLLGYDQAAIRPRPFSRASTPGNRPRNARYRSSASREPPVDRICVLQRLGAFRVKSTARLFKCGKGVGIHNLGPHVAVVTRTIAVACKHMRKMRRCVAHPDGLRHSELRSAPRPVSPSDRLGAAPS